MNRGAARLPAIASPLLDMRPAYSNSRIIRRCGQLGIAYELAIGSRYFVTQGVLAPSFRIQYRDGVDGTTGWGKWKTPLNETKSTPHTKEEMLQLLDSPFDSRSK